ncbi:LPS assembly lipoprotein LptE [Candidatus Steffania adelgidicola]|uniref:LPS assembly lipoprotein LptE n=1 Tax=Candidatus Steffania adelgidicola TaxID=1076626 RepID=UPI001D00AC32|nr:LPS assembly lipoprotein LptE [Candidatus Steffania adelgidicola]UDG79953.1 LPS-assembly lipoprotein LptE [Candidatus Steffania adelgidicola]
MRYHRLTWVLGLVVAVNAGCGYHLPGTTHQTQTQIKNMTLNTHELYGPLTRAIREELHLNHVMLVQCIQDGNTLPSLEILNTSERQETASVFQNGKTAEYEITLNIQAKVVIPGKDYHLIDIKVHRSFFDNILTVLAKDAEGDIIRQEMRQQAAQQLVRTLLLVYTVEKTHDMVDETHPKKQRQIHDPLVSRPVANKP